MIIKGILKTIDYNNNSCTVRLPLFETTSNSGEVVLPAIFMNQPGMFNGYNEGDIVFVDFENNKLEAPIIIGKLYLGSEKEASNSQKGGLKVASLTVDSNATLPLDTKLVFNHTSSDVPVDKGLSSYKSIIDIIKAIHTTETTLEKVTDTQNSTNDSFIQRIEVTYLSQLAELEAPLATHEGWSIVIPASKDGYKIWQKTTTYNNKGQILGTPEIICISDLNGTASYWLKCSTKNHAGTQQSPTEAVEITAMIKLGLNIETEDTDATLYYKWSGEEEISVNSNKIVLTNNGNFKNKNLIIRAERNGITYLTETILYTPLNTPVLRFSRETDSLSYDSYGYNKLNISDTASVAATVLLNNEIIPATYTWTLEDCTNVVQRPAEPSWDPIEVSGSSITIYHIAETVEQATATCNAVYTDPAGNQQTLTKVFSISKNRQGKSLYKIDILNEFSTITLSYDDKYEDANLTFTEHTVSAFYGDDVLTFTVGNTPNTNSDNKSYYLYIKQTSGLTLSKVANQQTSAFTTKVNTITADTGEVIYELYRGNTKVASAKFELSVLRSGTPATNLWLVISHPVHTGSQQSTPITVQPKIQIGNTGIDNNTESYVGYKYESDETYTKLVWNSDRELFEVPLPYKAENIKIIASQNEDLSDSYEEEEITYSPLNTPVIDLTNDSDDLVYTPGGTKIDKDEIATSTASLWLNGEKLDAAQFTWKLVGCSGTSSVSADKKDATVIITDLTEAKGTAACTATYKGKTYTKVFSVAKQIQGDASTSYWLKLSTVVHTGTNQERPIEAIAMKKEGTKVETEDSSAKLYFRYFSDTSWSSTATSSCLINNYKNEDLYIVAVHGDYIPDLTTTESSSEIYDWETITYSPLNTPVIDLTNDRGSLTYNDQDKKLISDETTSTTATLYLNGTPVNATYEWTYNAGTEADDTVGYTLSNSNKTITISYINENINKAEATCRATYKGNTYTKIFTIIKNINSVKYWLKTSTKIHTGATSLDNIEIIAMRKEGTSAETPDTTAYLWYKFKSEQTWRKESDGSTHLININKADLKDEDLIIAATHNNSNSAPLDIDIYDQETITYSPKNTPVIDLTNDSDILPYDADGFIIGNPLAQTTAELYLNGEKINETNLSFSWVDASTNKNVITFEGETNKPTIKIRAISENTATATCNITIAANGINGQFANKTYSKDFKIVRQIKGDPTTIYKIVPSTATVTYTKAKTYIPANIEFNILESRGVKEPTIVDFATIAGLDLVTNQDGLEFTKTNSTYSLPSSNIVWPLEVSLIKDNVLIHKETINKVTDGTDGANATSPYTLDLVNDKVSVLSNTPFVDTDNNWWNEKTLHTLKVLQGITPVSFENITIKAGPYVEAETDNNIILTYQATNISSENLRIIPLGSGDEFEQNIYISGLTDPNKLVGTILYNLYVEKVLVATAKFEFLNILYGVDGETFGVNIIPSASSIIATETINGNNSSWTYSPPTITVKFTEVAGDTVIDCGDSQKRKYRYKIYVDNEDDPQNTVDLTPSVKTATITLPSTEVQRYRIELELQLENNTWINVDTESISVARNGQNGADGKDGTDATSYWLKGVEAVHLGSKQTTNINIVAVKQTGLDGIEDDTDAILWWTFEGKEDGWGKARKNHTIQFTAGPGYALSNNKDITIFATHNESFIPTATTTATDPNIYEWEIITYSPLNTPVLDLSNDSASLNYTAEGTKINTDDNIDDKVSSTATLYLNGEAITTASYIWYLENCITDIATTTNNTHLITDTISINTLTANNGTATCLAFKDKDIKAVVIRSGWLEESWIRYSTDTSETWTGSTAINPGEYFVIVGRAIDSKKLHIILGQATSDNNGEISGSAVSYDEAFTKVFSISKQLQGNKGAKGDNGDAISIKVENAFYAINEYDVDTPDTSDLPDGETQGYPNDLTNGQWAILSKYPQKAALKNSNYKLVFHSSRVVRYNETTQDVLETQAWSLPVLYWCANEEAYRILTTAEGLFGYGQGVYYTPAPERDENGKIIGDKEITLDDRITKYTTGEKMPQNVATDYVAGSPSDRKDDLELYIDAEYIRTGSLRVEKDTDGDSEKEILFEAGLDNNTVKIGGFEVDGKSLSAAINTSSTVADEYKYVERSFDEAIIQENEEDPGSGGIIDIEDVSSTINPTDIYCHEAGDLYTSATDQEIFNQIYADTDLLTKLETGPWIEFSVGENHYICTYNTTLTKQDEPEKPSTAINDIWDIYIYDSNTETWKKDGTKQLKTNVITKYEAKVYVGTDKIEVTNGDKVVKLQNGTLFANSANISGTITATAGNIGDFKLQNKGLVVQQLSEEDIIPLVSWLGEPLKESQVWTATQDTTKNTFNILTTQAIPNWTINYIYYDYDENIPTTFDATGSPTEEQIKNKLNLYLVLVINEQTTQEYKFKTIVEDYSIWERTEITQDTPFIATKIPVNISNSNLATTRISPEELFIGYEKEINVGYDSDYWFTITPEMLDTSLNLTDTNLKNTDLYEAIFINSSSISSIGTGNGTPWNTLHFSLSKETPSIYIKDSKLTLKLGYDVVISSFVPPKVDPGFSPTLPSDEIGITPPTLYSLGNNTPSVDVNILPETNLGGSLIGGQTDTKTYTYFQYFNVKQINKTNDTDDKTKDTITWQSTSGSTVITTSYWFPYKLTVNGTTSPVNIPLVVKVPKKDSYVKAEANGALTANNATISGNLQAEAGKIGGFDIYENGLYSDFIELSKDSLILAGGSFTLKSSIAYNTGESISLDTSRLNPAIVFSGNGGIIDQTGSVGLTFKAGESNNQINYKAYFYATGANGLGGKNYITITIKAEDKDKNGKGTGVWSTPLALQKDRTFTIYHKGWNLGTKIKALSITLKAGEHTKTVEFDGYLIFYGASWTSNGYFVRDQEIANEEDFEQSEVVPASLYALSNILPQETDTVFGTISVFYNTGYGSPVNTYRYEGTQEISGTTYHIWSGNHGATGHPTVYYTEAAPKAIVAAVDSSPSNSTTLHYMKGSNLTNNDGDNTPNKSNSAMYISSKSITITSGCSLGSDTAKWSGIWTSALNAGTIDVNTLNATNINAKYLNAEELTGNVVNSDSDLRLKQNINYDISKYDNLFDSLKPASYQFKSDLNSKTHLGFIAQEVEQSLFDNNLTRKDFAGVNIRGEGFDAKTDTILDLDKTTYALGYNELHALEVRQIQLLKARVQELETKIEQLTKSK